MLILLCDISVYEFILINARAQTVEQCHVPPSVSYLVPFNLERTIIPRNTRASANADGEKQRGERTGNRVLRGDRSNDIS